MPIETWNNVTVQEAEKVGAELRGEVARDHVLASRNATAVRRCSGCDDVLFRIDGDVFAVVHLAWSGTQEPDSWPRTVLLPSFLAVESYIDSHNH